MNRFYSFIVQNTTLVVIVFVLLLIPSFIGFMLTDTNYDILSYMPDDLNSKKGERILEEEFALSGTSIVMVRDRELWEIKELKSQIQAVDGVENVVWIDDFTDITVPVAFMDSAITDQFITGDSTILQIQFKGNASSFGTAKAIEDIRELIGDGALFGGQPVIMRDLQTVTEREKNIYIAVAVVTIFIILSLSMTSWVEPILFLLSVGVAVLLNLGTNIIKGEVSFMTASIAAVMQLGVSMDYSIFLLHRFEEEKLKFPSIKDAMVSALSKTTVAIASSALTTIAGFAALMTMQNGIGPDLGFVLGKGVLLSLIVNLTLLPCLILMFNRVSDKYRHRIYLPTFKKASTHMIKARWAFFAIIIILTVPSFIAQSRVDYYYTTEHYLPETSPAVMDTTEIRNTFGSTEVVYVVTPNGDKIKEKELMDKIKEIDVVDSVWGIWEQVPVTIPDSIIPQDVMDKFSNHQYSFFSVIMKTSADDGRTFKAISKIRSLAGGLYDEYYVTGPAALVKDLADLVDTDNKRVAIVSIALIAVILAFSFKSLSIPFILILAIQLAIWMNLSIPYYFNDRLSSLTPMIIGAIQLGATVDYAILFTSRYKENIPKFKKRKDAARQTIVDTGRSILTSALIMVSATIGISFITSIKTTGEMTMLIGRGALISMMVIFLALPSFLLIFDKIISWTSIKWINTSQEGDVHNV